eukprot:8403294-Pyramimonas_sp.AAC.1
MKGSGKAAKKSMGQPSKAQSKGSPPAKREAPVLDGIFNGSETAVGALCRRFVGKKLFSSRIVLIWGVECILAVIGTGGPVKRIHITTYTTCTTTSKARVHLRQADHFERGADVDVKGYVADVKGHDWDVKGYGADVKGYEGDVKGYDGGGNGAVEGAAEGYRAAEAHADGRHRSQKRPQGPQEANAHGGGPRAHAGT